MLRHVARLFGPAGGILIAYPRFVQIPGASVRGPVSFAGHRAVTGIVCHAITGRATGRGRGPGCAPVEGTAHIQLVAIITHGIEAPVGRPGIQEHDHIAIEEAAMALGHIQGVVPGLIIQIGVLIRARVGLAIHRGEIARHLRALRWALMPGQDLGGIAFALYLALQNRVGVPFAELADTEIHTRTGCRVTGLGINARIWDCTREVGGRRHAHAVGIVGIGAVGEHPARTAIRILTDHIGVSIRIV